MIGYLSRVAPVILKALIRRDGRTVSRITRRVHLREIDPNLHMNQAVYAEVLEHGRTDWLISSGAFGAWRTAGLHPIVAEQHIVYRRELKPLQRYVVETRAVAIEGRLLVFDQLILVGDRVHVRGTCKALFLGPDGVRSPEEVAPHLEPWLSSPRVVEDWRVTD